MKNEYVDWHNILKMFIEENYFGPTITTILSILQVEKIFIISFTILMFVWMWDKIGYSSAN